MFSTLISAAELQQQISESRDLVIFDCRFNLMDTDQGEQLYREGHIPGAAYLHLDNDLSSPITPETGRHPMPDQDKLVEKLVASGMNSTSQVVVYDDCGGAMAARAWWLIRLLGHKSVAVLDGGYPAWVNAGAAVTETQPETIAGNFSGCFDSGQILPLTDVGGWPDRGMLIDARTPERFRGEQEPIDPVAGHIPGAINRALQLNLNEAGLFKSAATLKQEWQTLLGESSPEQVVHYCGSGVTACHNLLAMEHAGLNGSRIYPGSWSEWIRDPARAVATGEQA